MKYIIVAIDWCTSHGIIVPEYARKNLKGDKVILHKDFIAPVLTNNIKEYQYDSKELKNILDSDEWTDNINEKSYD